MRPAPWAALAATACCVAPGAAQTVRRGVFDLRDGHLLAQATPQLVPLAAGTALDRGRRAWRLAWTQANTFAWSQDVPGESPRVRRYLLDGETTRLALVYAHGLATDVEAHVRLEVAARGGGWLDAPLDAFHRAFAFAGVGDGARPAFLRGALRAEGLTAAGRPFSWSRAGWGSGPAEVGLTRTWRASLPTGETRALAVRLCLPTGSGPFTGQALGVTAQWALSRPVAERTYLDLGGGLAWAASRRAHGLDYERWHAQGFVGVERVWRRASLVAGTQIGSRLTGDVAGWPGLRWSAHAGLWWDVGRRRRLGIAVVENIAAQAATADLAVHVALAWHP